MPGLVDTEKGKTLCVLDGAVLLAGASLHVSAGRVAEGVVAGPLESIGPSLVAEPVADEVDVTGVDQHGNLSQDIGHHLLDGQEPVAALAKGRVDLFAAVFEAFDLYSESLQDLGLVEPRLDVVHFLVAEVSFTILANVVHIEMCVREGLQKGAVTGFAGAETAVLVAVVARLDSLLASREGICHGLAGGLVKNGLVATLSAGHGLVGGVLKVGVGKAVANHGALEVNVAVLVGQDLFAQGRDVVAGIRLAGDVEVLLGVLRELLEEQRQEGVDVLCGGRARAHILLAVGEAGVDGLVKEDDVGVVVPRKLVADNLALLVDVSRAQLCKEASHGRASRPAGQPKDDGILGRIIAGLEEPCREVLVLDLAHRRHREPFDSCAAAEL